MDKLTIDRLENWLGQKNNLPKIIVVYGPTGCGKSKLAVEIGKYLLSPPSYLQSPILPTYYSPFIVSIDARQIYRGLDIGTGKIGKDEMGEIPHYMLDVIDPSETFSVVNFRNMVEDIEEWKNWKNQVEQELIKTGIGSEISQKQEARGKKIFSKGVYGTVNEGEINFPDDEIRSFSEIPILCGGTGLYIDSLIFERSYPQIEGDEEMRTELEEFRIKNGNEALWKRLNDIDPEYANILHPNNYHYVIRGIEVMMKTGKSKLTHIDKPTLKYDTFFITPYDGDREALYEKINSRVEEMFLNGLIEEVGYNIGKFTSSAPGLKTIGYKEVVDYIEGKVSLDECKNLVKQHNRNYAKRQITWNKKYDIKSS